MGLHIGSRQGVPHRIEAREEKQEESNTMIGMHVPGGQGEGREGEALRRPWIETLSRDYTVARSAFPCGIAMRRLLSF